MNKKGFVDTEILTSPGFVILCALSVGATVLGYILSKKWDLVQLPVWQFIILIIAEVIGSYFFAARG